MPAESPSRLKEFPVAWFAVVMGLAGYTIAWNRATIAFGLSFAPGRVLLAGRRGRCSRSALVALRRQVRALPAARPWPRSGTR